MNNVLLSKELETKVCVYLKRKTNVRSVIMYYQLTSWIYLPNFVEFSKCYIWRCFLMVAETQQFLEVDYKYLSQIISSSELNITSELEVFKAAENWISYKRIDRSKYAKELLLKVRLPLLSDHTLDFLLSTDSFFLNNEECVVLMKEILKNKNVYRNSLESGCNTRYCNHKMFDVFELRNGESTQLVQYDTNKNNLDCVINFSNIRVEVNYFRPIFYNGTFYVFCFIEKCSKYKMSVRRYSSENSSWEHVAEYSNNRVKQFCVCGFMGKLYSIGGMFTTDSGYSIINTCVQFDPIKDEIQEVKPMNRPRYLAACAVFEGRVVVSGGFSTHTAEVYDHVADKWSYMPGMTRERCGHGLVVVRNKLFAVGGGVNSCEVFDSRSKKFVLVSSPPPAYFNFETIAGAVSKGNKVIIFRHFSKKVACYDLDKEQWSKEKYESDSIRTIHDCVKFPHA